MSVIASWRTKKGIKRWQVSSSYIMDLDGLTTGFELNAESNNQVEGSPLTNQRGMKKKTLSFYSTIHAALGLDVRKEFESWEPLVGQTGTLMIGGKKFGPNWLLTAVKPSEVKIDDSGRFRSMKLTFSFEENGSVSDMAIANGEKSTQSAMSVTPSSSEKEAKKANNTQINGVEKTWAYVSGGKIELNDVIEFIGGPGFPTSTSYQYSSARLPSGKAKLIAIVTGASNPYKIKRLGVDDKFTEVWVKETQIKKTKTRSGWFAEEK